jgi:hypothetical protein
MSVVDMHKANLDSRLIYDRLRSSSYEVIEGMFRALETPQMNATYSDVNLRLGQQLQTKHLDLWFKKELRGMQVELDKIRKRVLDYRRQLRMIGLKLEGYPKYRAICELDKIDPIEYHDWVDLQAATG